MYGCVDRKWPWRSSVHQQWWWGLDDRPCVNDDVRQQWRCCVVWPGGAASKCGHQAHGST
ncbi:hypothetical protein BDA96_03G029500 [Sorghum bicolor]|uniref:Uncharacterized protein n=1 Tax=Sorghum bicolor TaxID=4558 RepID=A0A921ULW6_SORBI|nr:hypothetical protein BDA96_03G029500 [Sorghum bicolor]